MLACSRLQWGRGSLAAACVSLLSAVVAEMIASMGPRLISRGVIVPPDATRVDAPLQWGRGSLAAAWPEVAESIKAQAELQWGRGSLAAAWRTGARGLLRIAGFNGAAAH